MKRLDQRDQVLKYDPKGMYALTEEFPNQCRRALAIAQAHPIDLGDFKPSQVVLTGLGGSAAGGDIVRALFDALSSTPFSVNRDYTLPGYVGPNTLVIAASYSGMTEETLAAYADAQSRGARIIGVTSGGELAQRCEADGHPCILIPGGQPPRTALGYMMIPALYICESLGLLPAQNYETAFALLDRCAYDWAIEAPLDSNPTKQLAANLKGKLAVIYGLGAYQTVAAYRWKAQINENAKNMAFYHAFPELCHNETLGWVLADRQNVGQWCIVLLEDGSESNKMKERARVTFQMVAKTAPAYRVQARGQTLLERALSLVFFGDYVSLYLACLNEVDPENIDSINILKAALAKID